MKSTFRLLLLFIIASTSCSKIEQPFADFEYTVQDLADPSVVAFTNTSKNAYGFKWIFGDGQSSVDKNPVHTFSGQGSFSVKMIAINKDFEDETTKEIDISAPPNVEFDIVNNNCNAVCKVNFDNLSSGIYQFSWDFGDHSQPDDTTSPNHDYSAPGIYDVTLTGTLPNGHTLKKIHKVTIGEDNSSSYSCAMFKGIEFLVLPCLSPSCFYAWDDNSDPDVYFKVYEGSTLILDTYETAYINVDEFRLPIGWDCTDQCLSFCSDKVYTFEIWDRDDTGSDFMYATAPLHLIDHEYETTIHFSSDDDNVSFDLYLEW